MPDDAAVSALVFAGVGVLIATAGAYIRLWRRADLLANYDGSADSDHAAVHAGNVVVVTGVLMVAYGAAHYHWRLPEWSVLVVAVAVTILAFVAAARAQGA